MAVLMTLRVRRIEDGLPMQIQILEGRIVQTELLPVEAEALEGIPFIGPGLFDIQINGYQGNWFCDEHLTIDTVFDVSRALVNNGVSMFFPTLITCSAEAMEHGLNVINQACQSDFLINQIIQGCHLEGPYISAEDGPRGAHPVQHVRPASWNEFQRWQEVSGNRVRLVTLAPEAGNACEFIEAAVASGVKISLGHTAASPQQIRAAVDAGATLSTHLGNGCPAMIHRHQNVFWPQLEDDRLATSVIADGWHVPAEFLRTVWKCKGHQRTILTSDVSGYGGCLPGRYESPNVAVEVLEDGRIVVADQRQYLAGSGALTGDCVLHMQRTCGLELKEAWNLASALPAKMFEIPCGGIDVGDEATLTLFRIEEGKFVPIGSMVKGVFITGEFTG
ncbi:MAG: amidohydrolase family protein [Planctomyces sp.]|nr:amidohydrolase family protein [Planctomyces sp.]